MNQVALVFGASSGIGFSTAKQLLEKGYIVFNASREQAPQSELGNISCDVTKAGDIERAVQTVLDAEKQIDVLIYSPGFSMAAPIEYAQEEDYRYLFDVNYFGAVKALQAVTPSMRQSGGRIILVSSLGSNFPIAFDSFYSSSKAALDMLARGANIELNPYQIFVTAFQAGPTCTRFTFKRKVYPEQNVGVYGKALENATTALATMEQSGMHADTCANGIVDLLEQKKPPIVCSCGLKNKVYTVTNKFLPVRMADWIDKQLYLQ